MFTISDYFSQFSNSQLPQNDFPQNDGKPT
jgi:hypothetical protein